MENIDFQFSGVRHSRVFFGNGALDALAEIWRVDWKEAVILGDSNVIALYGKMIGERVSSLTHRVHVMHFQPGEENKSRQTKELLEDQLLGKGFGRQTCIVGVGGGISLDLAGFLAATYLRGVDFINVPTSLLAQLDASIGGKTGVNTVHGKNLIGAFHQPTAVIIEPSFLSTLPTVEWRNGLAEMVKHAVIEDASFFDWIENNTEMLAIPHSLDLFPLRRCLEIKSAIVCGDERENGHRAVLNFGHTIGHAVEGASSYLISHGEAVALGMLVEGRLARRCCGFPVASLERLASLWHRLGFSPFPTLSFNQIEPFLAADKKRLDSELRLALPVRIGKMAGDQHHTVACSLAMLREVWDEDLR